MAETVIDASALLAMLNQEAGSDVVAVSCRIASSVRFNLSEVAAKLSAAGLPPEAVYGILRPLGLVVIPFGEEQAYEAGLLRRPPGIAGHFDGRPCLPEPGEDAEGYRHYCRQGMDPA